MLLSKRSLVWHDTSSGQEWEGKTSPFGELHCIAVKGGLFLTLMGWERSTGILEEAAFLQVRK